jgi:hypothetical protein
MKLLSRLFGSRSVEAPKAADRLEEPDLEKLLQPIPEPVPNALQQDTIDAAICIFETGRLPGLLAYSAVALLADKAGISYGMHQSTAKSGSLAAILDAYYARGGTLSIWSLQDAQDVAASSVGKTAATITPGIQELMRLLRLAGRDQRMQDAQDQCFWLHYAEPATAYGRKLGLRLPLSYLCVRDLWVHSGVAVIEMLRKRFKPYPPSLGGEEKLWTTELIKARRAWLASHSNETVRKTVYRCDAILQLIAEDRWDLARPLTIQGRVIE